MAKGTTEFPLLPIGDKIVVERSEAEETTKGGIVLPDTAKEKPRKGTVMAVGAGRLLKDGRRVEPSVKPGDRVIFASYGGSEVRHENKDYLILSEDEVLAVIE